jgi:FMN-dependent NADH-azoreductase
MKPAEAMEFAKQVQSIGEKSSPVFACMEAFDKKHGKETTKDKAALAKKLLKEMQSKGECVIGAAVINLGVAKGAIQ